MKKSKRTVGRRRVRRLSSAGASAIVFGALQPDDVCGFLQGW